MVLNLAMTGQNKITSQACCFAAGHCLENSFILRGYRILERFIDQVGSAIQAMIHDSGDARIRCSTPVHDSERNATSKR